MIEIKSKKNVFWLSMDMTRGSVTLSENSTVSLNLVSEIKYESFIGLKYHKQNILINSFSKKFYYQ